MSEYKVKPFWFFFIYSFYLVIFDKYHIIYHKRVKLNKGVHIFLRFYIYSFIAVCPRSLVYFYIETNIYANGQDFSDMQYRKFLVCSRRIFMIIWDFFLLCDKSRFTYVNNPTRNQWESVFHANSYGGLVII